MKIVIDIDENVFTRLFDSGAEDYAIMNDDLFAIAKSIRKGTLLEKMKAEIDKLPRIKVGNSNSPTVKYCIDEVLIYDLLEKGE